MREMKRKWLVLVSVTCIGLFIDWITKYLADTKLVYGSPFKIAGDYLQLLLVYNRGALFGLNPRAYWPDFPVNAFFFIFTAIAITVLILYYRSIPKKEIVTHWGLALILPGAFGNLLDRVLHGHKGVVDFIRLGLSDKIYWPIFNMADVYVTAGVCILFYSFILEEKNKKNASGNIPISQKAVNEEVHESE